MFQLYGLYGCNVVGMRIFIFYMQYVPSRGVVGLAFLEGPGTVFSDKHIFSDKEFIKTFENLFVSVRNFPLTLRRQTKKTN